MAIVDKFRAIRIWGMKGAFSAACRLIHDWSIYRELKKNFKIHAGTVPVRGITVIAPMSGSMSLSKTMRDFVFQLHRAGIPCQVFDTYENRSDVVKKDYAKLVTAKSEFNVLKYTHVVEMLKSPLPQNPLLKRCRIAFWEGEAGILKVFPYLMDSDIIIAMSDFNESYYRREFPSSIKVAKIIYPLLPISTNVLEKDYARIKFGISRDSFVVFYNLDIRADYRKNLKGTVDAFAGAFQGCQNCLLVLKINGSRQSNQKMADLSSEIARHGIQNQVKIITEYLSQQDLYSLTNACDVYLSLHRAEGFGLGIAEAMSMGKAVVLTDYSGVTEFSNYDTAVLVPYKKISIKDEGFWVNMETWADPDVGYAVKALRNLYENHDMCVRLGHSAQEFIGKHFSLTAFTDSVNSFLNMD